MAASPVGHASRPVGRGRFNHDMPQERNGDGREGTDDGWTLKAALHPVQQSAAETGRYAEICKGR
jgi:hypothetical protein